MKFLLLIVVSIAPLFCLAQTSAPAFNWKTQEISKDNNLQRMSIHDETTAVIAGYGGTFKISTDKGVSWNDVGLFDPRFNFIDMSFEDSVGYIVGRKTALVRYPTGGEDDVYISGVLLKTIDNGSSWSVMDLSAIGEGEDPGLNPNAKGCISLDPFAVLCLNDTVAMVFLQWNDVISGTKKPHSAVFKTTDGGEKWTAITIDFGGAYINAIKRLGSDIYIGGNKILQKASIENDVVVDLFPAFSLVAGSKVFINDIRFFDNEIYVQTLTGCFISRDHGTSFSKIDGLTGGNDIFKLDSAVVISLGSSSNSKATIDGGKSWTNCYPGNTCWEIAGIFNDSLYALSSAVVFKLAINDLKNGNYQWTSRILNDGSSNLQKMKIFDDRKAMLVGFGQIAKITEDKGQTWTDATLPTLFSGGNYDFRSVSSLDSVGYVSSRWLKLVDYPSGEDYYLNGLIFKTTDAWKTWQVLNSKNIGKDSPDDASKNPTMKGCYAMDNYTIECAEANAVYVFVGWNDSISVPQTVTKHSRVYKTTDGGDSWTAVTKDFGGAIVMSMNFLGESGYLAGNKILLKTTDGGNTFTDLYPKLTIGTDSNLVVSSVVVSSADEVYIQTSNNKGVFVTKDGGNTFSKLNGVNGGFDFVVLDNNSFMAVGSSANSKYTNDGGTTWVDCSPGATIFAAGEVFNDSLYVLGKSNVYKVAVDDLNINTSVVELQPSNPLKVMYGTSALELVSDNRNIDRCMVYNLSGQLVAIRDQHDRVCRFEYNAFTPGIYIIAASVEGKKYTQKVIFK
jgi:photosystem II stability/assembly factor-like uncharacterized protein